DVVAAGLDTPEIVNAAGERRAPGSTNFSHRDWARFDMRGGLQEQRGIPVTYLNDGNAAALWGHMALFGTRPASNVSAIIGTGLGGGLGIDGPGGEGRNGFGGGLVVDGRVCECGNGFGGEVCHVLIPCEDIAELKGVRPPCNCGRTGDLESVCSLTALERTFLPLFLRDSPAAAPPG